MEVWKDFIGYEEYFKLSSEGRVYKKERYIKNPNSETYRKQEGYLLGTYIAGNGYMYFKIRISGKTKSFRLHRAMLKTFKPLENTELLEVNHIDGDKLNNKLSNLEWVTREGNIEHAKSLNLYNRKPTKYYKKKCNHCGCDYETLFICNKYCSQDCVSLSKRRVKRPSKEELYTLLKNNSFVSVGNMFGVTDNAIRKWCKSYGIPSKSNHYRGLG